jgi:hypothetical protein
VVQVLQKADCIRATILVGNGFVLTSDVVTTNKATIIGIEIKDCQPHFAHSVSDGLFYAVLFIERGICNC